ncbi:MAG: TRAP transporter substrate-binding protein DctP [Paracoccaceae bacterium]
MLIRSTALRAVVLCLAGAGGAAAQDLRISHQWSDTDVRHRVAEIVADGARSAGLEVEIFPRRALMGPYEQYDAMIDGTLEMAVLPLAYEADRHRAYDLTLMPGLVKNHDHAARLTRSPFMAEIERLMAGDDVMVLVHGYLAGGFMGADRCITRPEDVAGLTMRAAGAAFEQMLTGAGAGIASMPSSRLYEAMEGGVINGANTSSSSFVSYRLYERGACFTPPGEYALWFMYQPLLMKRSVFESLTPAQQTAIRRAAADAEAYYLDEAKSQDANARAVFASAGVEIADMSYDDYVGWVGLAKMTSYETYLADDPEALRLLNMALAVE